VPPTECCAEVIHSSPVRTNAASKRVGVGPLLVGVVAFALTLWGVSGDPTERSE
jgi:hypothetical protein